MLFAALVVGLACHSPRWETQVQGHPPEIQRACAVMARRCTRCHSLDRVAAMQIPQPRGWELLVNRMRLQPSSGISLADQEVIVRCIVYRKLGIDTSSERKGGSP